jgi:hypothetical protein
MGAGAHAPQWIEFDLGREVAVGLIRLTVAQFPAGTTSHTIRWAQSDGVYLGSTTLTGSTAEGDILVYEFPARTLVRFIRIETIDSPSWIAWREIAVSAP